MIKAGKPKMTQFAKETGLTIVEVIIVAGMISLLVVIAGSMTSRFFANRKVDNITRTISSTLQIAKLKSARHGVEYQAVINYDNSNKSLTIAMQIGDSNRGSESYRTETFQELNVLNGVTITPSNKIINFNPNGTLGGSSGSITIRPIERTKIRRCGRIVVTPFGRIRVLQGNWDGTTCKPIREP
jgi:Tfp pilus assembly protein FimT